MTDGMPMFFEVTAEEIHFAIRECIEEICKAITEVLEVTPPELVNDITDDGIFLCGGVAGMYGLDKFIEKQTEKRRLERTNEDRFRYWLYVLKILKSSVR